MVRGVFLSLVIAIAPLLAQEEGREAAFPLSVQEFQHSLQQSLAQSDWWAAVDYADLITRHFPASPFAEEAPFLRGEAYLGLHELELANASFTEYLNQAASPKHFEEAIHYKFSIAEKFRNGVKKPLFGSHKLPKIVSAKEDALKIYDEVIATLPHHEITAQSLLGKAKIQAELEDYKPSLETLDLLIRRFPKHEFTPEAYLEKGRVYLAQAQAQSPDPSLLDLAALNLRKFRLAFPREARIIEAEKTLAEMEEVFAQNLFKVGRFFEKTKKIPASLIYYNKLLSQYPNTEAALYAREKLERLQRGAPPS